jgi:hypothetical protein
VSQRGHVGEIDDIASAYPDCMTQPFSTGAAITVGGGASS